MITISDPDYGWITLNIEKSSEEKIEIDFSDVGPHSLNELLTAIENLSDGRAIAEINFFLEPSLAQLNLSKQGKDLKFEYYRADNLMSSFLLNEKKSLDQFRLQLKRIIPLCIEPHWTQEIFL